MADEMNFMTALREFCAKFSCQNTRPAGNGVAGDGDFQGAAGVHAVLDRPFRGRRLNLTRGRFHGSMIW
jgi:hypothetical protein